MVYDQGMSTKAGVLAELRRGEGVVSGDAMGRKMGVSRVAVWKAARSLQAAGYPIVAEGKGYRLLPGGSGGSNDDFLYPWEFAGRNGTFYYFYYREETDSTMNRVRELAYEGMSGGAVFVAGSQSGGRGRRGKTWVSDPGGLFFTLLEWPGCGIMEAARYAMLLQIATVKVIAEVTGKEARLRWPNDLYVGSEKGGKKIAGTLMEFYAEGDRVVWLSLGLGLNVNNPATLPDMVNGATLAGHPLSRRALLAAILDEWAAFKRRDLPAGDLCGLWNQAAQGIGANLRWPPQHTGVFKGIDALGRAVVETKDGERHLWPGDVTGTSRHEQLSDCSPQELSCSA